MYTIDDMCLICLTNYDKNLKSIKSKDSDGVVVQEKLRYFLLEIDYITPETCIQMCLPCLEKIDYVYKFKQLCLQNIVKFNSYKKAIPNTEPIRNLQITLNNEQSLKENLPQCENDYNNESTSENFNDVTVKIESSESEGTDTDYVLQSTNRQETELRKQNYAVNNEVIDEFADENVNENPEKIYYAIKKDLLDNLKNKLQEKLTQETDELIDVNNFIKVEQKDNSDDLEYEFIVDFVKDEPDQINDDNIKSELAIGSKNKLENHSTKTAESSSNIGTRIAEEKKRKQRIIPIPLHTGEKLYECDICDKTYLYASSLRKHRLTHTGDRPYECDLCDKSYLYSSSLAKHKLTHTGEKPYECETCAKSFYTKHQLKDHFRVHTGEKPYECDVCNKSFSHTSTLLNHKRLHTGERPFECNVCGQLFAYLRTLQRHRPIHTDSSPYKCNVCYKGFNHRCNLKRHLKLHIKKHKPK